jgi:hypothetical protein
MVVSAGGIPIQKLKNNDEIDIMTSLTKPSLYKGNDT